MSKLKKSLAVVLIVVMVAGLMTACGKTNNGSSSADTSSGSNKASEASESKATEDVQELNLRTKSFGNNYDVQDMGWRWMMAACYEGLYRDLADQDGDTFELAGAESVDIAEDGLTYTFHLRQDAKWSDGVSVTAADYEYGWKRLIDPSYGYSYASFIFNIAGAEEYYNGEGSLDDVAITAVDEYTFEVKLNVADPSFTYKLVATPLYPTREDLATAAGDSWGADWTLCVYNGPFSMTELVEDNKMVWTKNKYYWNADNVQLEKVNWFVIAEDATAATMFENGELDVFDASGNYIEKYAEEVAAGNYQSMETQYPGTYMLCYEFENGGLSGLMNNVKVRKAIAYAINKEEMIDAVYGRYSAAYGLVSPAITLNDKNYISSPIKDEYDEYVGNNEKLQALLAEGIAELGLDIDISDVTITLLTYGSTTDNQTEREYIQQSLEQSLGCKVELNTVGDYDMFKVEREAFNYDLMISSWYSDYNAPLDFFNIFGSESGLTEYYGLYSSAEYDALLASLSGETDVEKITEIYSQLEKKLLVEDCAFIPIYYADKHLIIQNWVKDFYSSSFGASQEVIRAYISGRTAS